MKKEINDLLLKMQTGENCIGETANQLLDLFAVSGSLLPLDVHKKARELSAGEFINWWFAQKQCPITLSIWQVGD